MKKIFQLLLVLSITVSTHAHGKEKVFFKNQTIETADATISIMDAVSEKAYTKLKIRIKNKTSDILVFKPQEIVFVIDGKEYTASSEKTKIIAPSDEASEVIDLKGNTFRVYAYTLKIGSLYRAVLANQVAVPDFKLPAPNNDFTVGGFKCMLKKQIRTTQFTEVAFECNYTGSKMGVVDPGKVSLKMPNGREYANMHGERRPLLLDKGEADGFTLVWKRIGVKDGDMQFVDMNIIWKEAISEVNLTKMPEQVVKMEEDMRK